MEKYGINEYDWFFRHLELRIFRFGRLEFEKDGFPMGAFSGGNRRAKRWKKVISIHIPPRGEKAGYRPGEGISYSGNGFPGEEICPICATPGFCILDSGTFCPKAVILSSFKMNFSS